MFWANYYLTMAKITLTLAKVFIGIGTWFNDINTTYLEKTKAEIDRLS